MRGIVDRSMNGKHVIQWENGLRAQQIETQVYFFILLTRVNYSIFYIYCTVSYMICEELDMLSLCTHFLIYLDSVFFVRKELNLVLCPV